MHHFSAEKLNINYETYRTQMDLCLADFAGGDREREKDRLLRDFTEVTEYSAFSAAEYFMYDFARKSRAEQSAFLPNAVTLELFRRLNDRQSAPCDVRNKGEVYRLLQPYYRRQACPVTGPEDKAAFLALLKEKQRLFCKPLCGSLGEKTRIVRASDMADEAAFRALPDYYGPEGFLAEELIHQSDFMMRLNPTSVNTLRIMTLRTDNRLDMYFESRIGEMFSIVDNLDRGSLICGIDHRDGRILSAYNKNRTPFPCHPHTRARVVGEKIPRFEEAVELAKELARAFPSFRYLAWDLALTDEGWVIVELNGMGGIGGFQEVYNRGMRRELQALLAELGKPTDFAGLLNDGDSPPPETPPCPHAEFSYHL